MRRILILPLLLAISACGPYHQFDVAAPQNYRPQGQTNQWRIEGKCDTLIDNNAVAKRTLVVLIDGQTAVNGDLPTDIHGLSFGTLDGTFRGARIHVDCSSERKTESWVELRCRIAVNDEVAVTLSM